MKIKSLLRRLINMAKSAVASDKSRRKLSFYCLNAVLSVTSFVMSILNIFTKEYILLAVTLAFSLACLLNILMLYFSGVAERTVYMAFGAEALIMLTFFIVSGIPNGFSVLWICLIPSFALLILGVKKGSAFSLSALALLVFFFWIPFGRRLLLFSYTSEFMLRFPFLYVSIYAISFVNECIRRETQKQLDAFKEEYVYLYRHDALTGLYNRYGIKNYLDGAFASEDGHAAIIMFDIDDFKAINDIYGHECGDEVLKAVSQVPLEIMCSHCKCCRWGGEEFLLVMQCEHNPTVTAENIRREIERLKITYNNTVVKATISVGVCVVDRIGKITAHQAIDKADMALYNSKSSGKNRVTTYRLGSAE